MKDDETLKAFLSQRQKEADGLRYEPHWVKEEKIEKNRQTRRKSKIKRLSLGIGIPLAATMALSALIIIPNLETKTNKHTKTLTKKASSISKEEFKSLNSVEYPSYSSPEQAAKANALDEAYVTSVNSFAYSLYQGLELGEDNVALSPYSIYRGLDILSLIGNESTQETFSSILGESSVRSANRAKGFLANNWNYDDEGVLMRDGAFFSTFFGQVKSSVIDNLTSAYVEGYQMDFTSESHQAKMVDWLNGYALDEGVFSMDDLPKPGYDETPSFVLFSLQSVKLHWATPFNEKDNRQDTFYKLDGTQAEKEFMSHVSYGVKIYDYDTYYSAYDAYRHGYYVQYLIPKSVDDNILELLDRNFLIEDESKRLQDGNYSSGYVITKFLLPKFSYIDRVDLTSVYQSLGLSSLTNPDVDSFGEAYEIKSEVTESDIYNHYLKAAKSVTKISMDEDGFVSKSLVFHFSMAAGSAAEEMPGTYCVNLNQPFVYVIRDANGLPLNLGYYQG